MKVALITTIRHNVGDDFVREGIKYLLKKSIKEKIEFTEIHKHEPISSRYGFEKDKWLNRNFKHLDNLLPLWIIGDRIIESDIVVQCGAPVFWYHGKMSNSVDHNEWYTPLIKRRFLKKSNGKLLNIAAGSCQKYYSDGSEFNETEAIPVIEFIKEFYELSAITTVRDALAKKILHSINIEVDLIPCPSIFAADEHGIHSENPEYVVMNYMRGGAHYTFGQDIDFEKWEKTFQEVYLALKDKENIVVVCHTLNEVEDVKRIIPNAKTFFSNNFADYLAFYSKAKFGIMNRVHGAFIIAGFGRPALIIGNDSRATMASEIGLKSYFVNEVDKDILLAAYNQLISETDSFKEKILYTKEKAFQEYSKLFSTL